MSNLVNKWKKEKGKIFLIHVYLIYNTVLISAV